MEHLVIIMFCLNGGNDIYHVGVHMIFLKHTNYGNGIIFSAAEINGMIHRLIMENKPFMAGRFGGTELSAMKIFDFRLTAKYEKCLEQLQNWSGFSQRQLMPDKLLKN